MKSTSVQHWMLLIIKMTIMWNSSRLRLTSLRLASELPEGRVSDWLGEPKHTNGRRWRQKWAKERRVRVDIPQKMQKQYGGRRLTFKLQKRSQLVETQQGAPEPIQCLPASQGSSEGMTTKNISSLSKQRHYSIIEHRIDKQYNIKRRIRIKTNQPAFHPERLAITNLESIPQKLIKKFYAYQHIEDK